MASNYSQIPLTIRPDLRRVVDANNDYGAIASNLKPSLVYGETVVLCFSCVDSDGSPIVFNSGDTFALGLDVDFTHELTASLAVAISAGSITSIVCTVTGTQTPADTGSVTITGGGHTETFTYTALSLSGTTATLTVSTTASYSYSPGAVATLPDGYIAYSDNSLVDISNDWADIDRATGKISVRVNFNTTKFSRYVTSLQTTGYIELIRYPVGLSAPSRLLQDTISINPAVVYDGSTPVGAGVTYYTSAQVDALLAASTGETTLTATGAISALRVVTVTAGAIAKYCDGNTAGDANTAIGITMTATGVGGGTLTVKTFGTMTDAGWSWTPGAKIYCGAAGALVTDPDTPTAFAQQIAVAQSATTVKMSIQSAIVKA